MTSAIARKHDPEHDLYECTSCQSMKPRAAFSRHRHCLYGLNPICRNCARLKSQKHWAETREALRAKRAALAPVAVTPKPKPEQRPWSKDAARMQSHKPTAVYPKDDPALCVHAGASCGAQEGFALVHELFRANVCGGVTRGYFATVGADAEGLVFPRFARKETAALWSAMVKSRFGVREEREAA